jgi:hypothetical protein
VSCKANNCGGRIMQEGLLCPFGCDGSAWRMYGLVSHLMDRHGYTEAEGWKEAKRSMKGPVEKSTEGSKHKFKHDRRRIV